MQQVCSSPNSTTTSCDALSALSVAALSANAALLCSVLSSASFCWVACSSDSTCVKSQKHDLAIHAFEDSFVQVAFRQEHHTLVLQDNVKRQAETSQQVATDFACADICNRSFMTYAEINTYAASILLCFSWLCMLCFCLWLPCRPSQLLPASPVSAHAAAAAMLRMTHAAGLALERMSLLA